LPLLAQIAATLPARTPLVRSSTVTKIFYSPYAGEEAAR
jgi:hypothetical protein